MSLCEVLEGQILEIVACGQEEHKAGNEEQQEGYRSITWEYSLHWRHPDKLL